jgi:hypothetical protein
MTRRATLLNSGSLFRVSLGGPVSWPANFWSPLLNRWPVTGPCGCRQNCPCFAGSCVIASESQKKRRKMPRSVTRANGSENGGKRGDQRAETGERRGAQFNRIVGLHCVVFYRLRAALDRTAPWAGRR